MSSFRSVEEFRAVMDRTFTLMGDDPEIGPRLRAAGIAQQFVFTDFDLVVSIRAGTEGEQNLEWRWSGDGEPQVSLEMSSETANRFFQGKENIAIGIARRQIRAGGDLRAALTMLRLTKPVFVRYREMIAAEFPHLAL